MNKDSNSGQWMALEDPVSCLEFRRLRVAISKVGSDQVVQKALFGLSIIFQKERKRTFILLL